MNKNIFLFILFYLFSFNSNSQVLFKADVLEITDTDKKLTEKLDLFFGTYINKNLVFGFTNEKAIADHVLYGYNPVKDSLNVSNFQLFLKYTLQKNTFFLIKIPTKEDIAGMSIFDRIRVGGGYIFHSENDLDFDLSYDLLLKPNQNGWRKGKITIGVSKILDANIPKTSVSFRLFQKFTKWLNTPLENGYRQSMYYSKSN